MKKFIGISVILILSFSCSNQNENKLSQNNIVDSISFVSDTNKNLIDSQSVLYVKSNSLVFFSLSNREFKQFIHRTGKQSEWDFDLMYKQFKKLAKNTKDALKNENINTFYSVNPDIAFITAKGDTLLFNRKENDLFIGQIFFNGKDTLYVEEGLMKTDSLENYIKHFFKLQEDINIKRTVIRIDNQKVIKKDTAKISARDTLSSP